MSRRMEISPGKVRALPHWLTTFGALLLCAGVSAAPLPSALPHYVDEPHGRPVDEELAAYSRRALEAALVARQRYLDETGVQSGSRPGLNRLASVNPVVLDWTLLAQSASMASVVGGTSDEPSGSVSLTTNPNLGCPGFYVLRTHANDVSQAGRFGAELNLTGSGARTLQGGLNFGGRATASVRGFSAFNIANATNELQVVTLGIAVGAPGRVLMERRSSGQVVATPIDVMVEAGEWEAVVTVPPGFYVVAYTPTTQSSTSYAISALTSYTNRPGGGFQGGVVVGGYHEPARATGAMQSTGFAGFCIARDFDVTARVLSRPTYGSSGSTGMAFSISRGDGTVFLDSRFGESETFAFQPQDPLAYMQWHLRSTGEPLESWLPAPAPGADLNLYPLWQNCPLSGCQGQGVVVAVVDDALEIDHPDLVDNVATNIPHRNVLEPGSAPGQDPSPQQSDDAHGTAVAGLIAARDNSIGGLGVASRATLIGINLLQANSSANDAEAMIHAGDVVAVSNNSWGAPDGTGFLNPSDQTWQQAVELGISQGLGGRGIVYVWAGGNGHEPPENDYFSDYSAIDGQANFHGVMAIGAANADDRRSSYSELGPNLLVSGYGGEFCGEEALTMATTDLSTDGWGYNHAEADEADIDFPDRRFTRCFNGTSSATPTVAGVVALMREANPALSWRDIRWLLAFTARQNDPGSANWFTNGAGLTYNWEYGFGAVDAATAVEAARAVAGYTLPPYTAENTASGQTGVVGAGAVVQAAVAFSSSSINRTEFVTAHVQIQGGSDSFDAGDLLVTLTSPAGVTALLTPKRRCTETDPDTEEKLWVYCEENLDFSFGAVQFLGENPSGTWTLGIDATSSPEPANLTNWSLTIHGHQGN
jgi:proprotein convertase subtilisin/kexin type 2